MINEYQKRLMAEGFLLRLSSLTNEQERVALVMELMNEMTPKDLPSNIALYGTHRGEPIIMDTKDITTHPSWLEEQRYSSNVENIND